MQALGAYGEDKVPLFNELSLGWESGNGTDEVEVMLENKIET